MTKYVMFIVFCSFLILLDHFMVQGEMFRAYTAGMGAIGAAIMAIHCMVEDRARKIVAAKELK